MAKYYTGIRDKRDLLVHVDGRTLFPFESQQIHNHSPGGFEWGYGGSGPSQLALAILLDMFGKSIAATHYQAFKQDFIETARFEGFVINSDDITAWLENRLKDKK